ncbi:MAG: bacteriohemerythrin [Leptospiraceae bacterium]|jgi:hemerythrin|nr:bacteriohemerythrin [Leptospiraceae bacterium]MCZ8346695.1 bacteriohemerythrin [Leptospiraceae bacterium]
MSIEWNDKYKTNIIEVDTQHKRLFTLMKELETLYNSHKGSLVGNQNTIQKAISDLEQYTISHFLIEERIMEENNYPDLENHKLQHDKFTDKIHEFKEILNVKNNLQESDIEENLDHILKFLGTWLTNHIMIKDMDYKPFIKHVL